MQVGDAYLIVYSITDRASFEKASELRIQLRRARQTEDIPIILVGNKSDLVRCREVSVSGERTGANTTETASGLSFGQVFFLPSCMEVGLGTHWNALWSVLGPLKVSHLPKHSALCGVLLPVHLVYLRDSRLPTPKGFPGIPLGKIYSGVFWQPQTFSAGPSCFPWRSQRAQRSRGSIFL